MPIVTVIVTLIVVGVILWLVNTYIPMAAPVKTVLNVVVVVLLCLWLLSLFGRRGLSIQLLRKLSSVVQFTDGDPRDQCVYFDA